MAIGTNDAVEKYGTQDLASAASPSAVSDGNFSVAADAASWVNDDDAVIATVILEAAFGAAPDSGSTVDLYARLIDIEGANDAVEPGSGASPGNSHVYLGSFPLDTDAGTQFIPIEVGLPNVKTSQTYNFYVRNNSGQTMSAGWQLHITPKAIGPAA